MKIFGENTEFDYSMRFFDVNTTIKTSNHKYTVEQTQNLFHDEANLTIFNLKMDYFFMSISFEIKIHEHDMTGMGIKNICDISYKMTILKDLENLLKTGKNADMELMLKDKSVVKVHKAILARSPFFRNIPDIQQMEQLSIDSLLMEKYLKFVYTGELDYETNEYDLGKLKLIAEKHQFNDLKDICSEMFKTKVAENKMKEGCNVS